MKIAVPTNDGINIAPDFGSANGCMIITMVMNEIVHEDIRWRNRVAGEDRQGSWPELGDCSCVILSKLNDAEKQMFNSKNISIVRSSDEIITNALVHYLEHEHLAASNTCCCP